MDKTNIDPMQPPPGMPGDLLSEVRTLGGYRLLRQLGEGGMGAVYLGYNEGRDQKVAIKVLADHLANNQAYIDRFYREAKSGALLNHPNIVRTLNVGQDQATGKYYLVLEFVEGQTAQALLDKQGSLALGDAMHIALDVARALEHAHSRSIVHRDIKPDNILITRSGVSKLVDLGLARRLDEASHLTAARQGFGTTYYMPYEQAINAKYADGRSDIYALGATLYHFVTGSVPFGGDNHLEVIEKKNQGAFTPASKLNATVPPVLDHILSRMLAREPRDRYQTASELIVDLERSRLAAPVATFADPNQALQDPWVQQCLSSSAEPTRLDPETPPLPSTSTTEPTAGSIDSTAVAARSDGVWVLRYRNPAGKLCRAQASTDQIVLRLRRGRLSAKVEARHASGKDYHPLSFYPEFKNIAPSRPPRKQPANGEQRAGNVSDGHSVANASGALPSPLRGKIAARPWYLRTRQLLLGGGLVVLLFLALVYYLLHR
ncbi:MAG TPA: serine/threonine-protein kinase [Gemmataceae bacterium]|nr:serine/threonine-protein kinase [Gemmataceae bacterium]